MHYFRMKVVFSTNEIRLSNHAQRVLGYFWMSPTSPLIVINLTQEIYDYISTFISGVSLQVLQLKARDRGSGEDRVKWTLFLVNNLSALAFDLCFLSAVCTVRRFDVTKSS